MSKLWSAIQAHYRPTAAYQASVVLIEATQLAPRRAAGAPTRAASYVVPIRGRAIDAVVSASRRAARSPPAHDRSVRGRGLRGDDHARPLDGVDRDAAPVERR